MWRVPLRAIARSCVKQPPAESAHVALSRSTAEEVSASTADNVDGDTLLQSIEPLPRERISDVRMLGDERARPPAPQLLESGARQLTQRVIPRVEHERGWWLAGKLENVAVVCCRVHGCDSGAARALALAAAIETHLGACTRAAAAAQGWCLYESRGPNLQVSIYSLLKERTLSARCELFSCRGLTQPLLELGATIQQRLG